MTSYTPDHSQGTCSFCGKTWKNDGVRVVSGPAVYICEECVGVCHDCLEAYPKADPGALDITCADVVDGMIPFEDRGTVPLYAPAPDGPCANCNHWMGNYNDPTEMICKLGLDPSYMKQSGCRRFEERPSVVAANFPSKIKEWNSEYGTHAYKNIRLIEKLREHFIAEEVCTILEILETMCTTCWNETASCCCSNDD